MDGADVAGWPVVAASLSLVVLALVLGWALGLRIGRDVSVAAVRAAAQLLAVGAVLALIFESAAASWLAVAWVAVMVVVASVVVRRRAARRTSARIPWFEAVTVAVVVLSAAISLVVTFGFGVLPYEPASFVVIAGITIGNAVPSAVLAVDQAAGLCRDRIGEIEAALALGLSRRQIVRFVAPRAARSSLIPQVERTKVVGLIALPGAMTGLLLAGVDPMDAVIIQILVMYLVLGTAALCVVALAATVVGQAVDGRGAVSGWVRPGPHDSVATLR